MQTHDLKPYLSEIALGKPLEKKAAREAFSILVSGEATPAQIGAFLMGLRVRGETIEEITAAAEVMRERMIAVKAPSDAIDIVGTGGDGAGTYNISTATALVVAACGVRVAKHGNRALSSLSGAGDVLSELGVKLDLAPDAISNCITKAGIGFMFAPNHHPAIANVGPMRRELGVRTVFNMLGPLSNPAGVRRAMVGVYDKALVAPVAEVLKNLGMEKAMVVHGEDGLDEITLTSKTFAALADQNGVKAFEITPEQAGLQRVSPEKLKGGTPQENAKALSALLAGEAGAYRDVVLLNAAASLMVADKCTSLEEGVEIAREAIDSGKAKGVLEALIKTSQEG